jgi:hypothetical protein
MADEVRAGDPDQPRKRAPLPDDDDDDRPRKRRRRDEDDDDDRRIDKNDDGSNTALSAVVPVGVSIWALLSLYTALLSCIIPGLGLLGLLFGILAFVRANHQASYGSITGNIRAVAGILISLCTIAAHSIWLFVILTKR